MITANEIHRLFDYDSKNGIFRYRETRGRVKADDIAGTYTPKGFRVLRVNGKNYYQHRIVWLCEKGYYPECVIKHRDGDISNNRIGNLYEVHADPNKKPKHNPDNIIHSIAKEMGITTSWTYILLGNAINKIFGRLRRQGLRPFEIMLSMVFCFKLESYRDYNMLIGYLSKKNRKLLEIDAKNI